METQVIQVHCMSELKNQVLLQTVQSSKEEEEAGDLLTDDICEEVDFKEVQTRLNTHFRDHIDFFKRKKDIIDDQEPCGDDCGDEDSVTIEGEGHVLMKHPPQALLTNYYME